MSTSPLRAAMIPVTRQMRAYFAPVDRTTETPTVFDPGLCGAFALDLPPSPWLDLGWVENFERWYDTPTDVVRSGAKDATGWAISRTARGESGLQLSAVGQTADGSRRWVGAYECAGAGVGKCVAGTIRRNASTRSGGAAGIDRQRAGFWRGSGELVFRGLPDRGGRGLSTTDWVCGIGDRSSVCEQSGGCEAGCELCAASDVQCRASGGGHDYVCGTVAAASGGVPPAGASAQVVVAFVDREGGSFFQEWSALFVAEEESGGRVCFYYPRLSPGSMRSPAGKLVREEFAVIEKPLSAISLRASFLALPYTDTNDGQSVLCYRSYFPAAMAAVY